MDFLDFDRASNHPYDCKCDICKQWWEELGPDGGEEGNYGPFDEDELDLENETP